MLKQEKNSRSRILSFRFLSDIWLKLGLSIITFSIDLCLIRRQETSLSSKLPLLIATLPLKFQGIPHTQTTQSLSVGSKIVDFKHHFITTYFFEHKATSFFPISGQIDNLDLVEGEWGCNQDKENF